jgi:hypothetical protein
MLTRGPIEALAHRGFPSMIASTTPQIARLIKDQVLHLALFGTQAGEVPTQAAESVKLAAHRAGLLTGRRSPRTMPAPTLLPSKGREHGFVGEVSPKPPKTGRAAPCHVPHADGTGYSA